MAQSASDPKVVIATDDSALGMLLSAEAEAVGVQAIWEVEGFAAQEAVLAHEPQAAMLDVNLPLHSGLELAQILRADPAVARELVVVLLSDDDIDSRVLERMGVNGIFPKTHDAAMLREWLMNVVAARR